MKINKLTIWSAEVLKRDNYICKRCGEIAQMAHHILAEAVYPQYKYQVSNGTALCYKCHKTMPVQGKLFLWFQGFWHIPTRIQMLARQYTKHGRFIYYKDA